MITWRQIEMLLYPELKSIAPHHQTHALKQAKKEPFELFEWAGILVGIVISVSVTRYSAVGLGMVERLTATLANFAIAVPLITILVGPFLVRRTRRGLQRYLGGRS